MKRRPFDVPDHGLWDEIKRSIVPLRRQAIPFGNVTAKYSGHTRPLAPSLQSNAQETCIPRRIDHAIPPPLMQFDRRYGQKLMRGQLEPEARIDLHGETVEGARMRLLHFLHMQHQQNQRLVLVITGKGQALARHTLHGLDHHMTPEREGRLRREVPMMLNEAPFRALVIGFQPAHPRHGGGGAFYLRLRRPPEHLGSHSR